MHYEPYFINLHDVQANAVRAVIARCIPCNILCMRYSTEQTQLRYQHGEQMSQTISLSFLITPHRSPSRPRPHRVHCYSRTRPFRRSWTLLSSVHHQLVHSCHGMYTAPEDTAQSHARNRMVSLYHWVTSRSDMSHEVPTSRLSPHPKRDDHV